MTILDQYTGPDFTLINGDSCEVLASVPTATIGLTITSIPFSSLFTYSASERDLGNCKSDAEFFDHLGYVTRELLRVTMPGRLACVHVMNLITTKAANNVIGLRDFRGMTIAHFQEHGWIYHGEVAIDKDPQAAAIRTKAKGLLFVQLKRDSSWMRPALADFLLLFRAPGENPTPITPDCDNEDWIRWARPIWYGIKETHTLNATVARDNADEKHICPMQFQTIERCIRLWSNRRDTILDPFAGIGSTGYVALQHDRRFLGIELNPNFYNTAAANLDDAAQKANALLLPFDA